MFDFERDIKELKETIFILEDLLVKYKKAFEILKRELFIEFNSYLPYSNDFFIHLKDIDYSDYDECICIHLKNYAEFMLFKELFD